MSVAGGCGWGEGREFVELVGVAVQYLVHRELFIASVPRGIERRRLDIRGCDRVPGWAFPLSVASIRAMNSSPSAAR